ncbi:MAG TPA: DUF3093 domain-containing protein [Actinomycetales bacterium]|nr:DUF3093 domain-containing protein [Actinomycetales bacterium]
MSPTAEFSERNLPSVAWWLLAPGFGAAMALALLPIGPQVSIIGAIVITVLTAGLLVQWAGRIRVSEGVLYAGPARIDKRWLGTARVLRGSELRAALGPDLDARTWLYIRPWLKSAVFIENTDPADPAPAWIIATRRPVELLNALGKDADAEN